MFDLCDLQQQEFALFSWYRAGKLTKKQYLAYIKPLDQAISDLEMATLQDNQALKKASLQHSQKLKH